MDNTDRNNELESTDIVQLDENIHQDVLDVKDEVKSHIHFVYPVYNKITIAEPVGISCLSSYLQSKGVKVTLDDAFLKGESVDYSMELIKEQKPDFVGISMNANKEVKPGLELARMIKELDDNIVTIVGGMIGTINHPTLIEDDNIDYIVVGDGEETLEKLIKGLTTSGAISDIKGVAYKQGGKPHYTGKPTSPNLGPLPSMDRFFLKRIYYLYGDNCGVNATIINTRGCVGSCNFCAINDVNKHQNGKKVRFRDVDLLVDEMEKIKNEFGISDFYFSGSIFLPGGNFGERNAQYFTELVKERKLNITYFAYLRPDTITEKLIGEMKESGMKTVFVGVESFDDQMLEDLEKKTTAEKVIRGLEILTKMGYSSNYDAEYRLKIGFITFTPYSTRENLKEQIGLIRKYRIPAKKLTYMWELFSDFKSKTITNGGINIHSEYSEEILNIHGIYKKLFVKYKHVIEKIRSIQKILGNTEDIKEENKVLYEFLYKINDIFYDYFEAILHSDEDEYQQLFLEYDAQISDLIDEYNIGELIDILELKISNLQLNDILNFRYKRAVENPQIES